MTGSRNAWQQLTQLLSGAGESVTLVAPYIKVAVLDDILAVLPDSVTSIYCVTRWSPGAVAAGVTDPEIIDTLESDSRAALRLCPSLHAKIYIADNACLVGSANLTRRGTETAGLDSNIEILISTQADNVEVQRVLQEIEGNSVPASRVMADLVLRQAEIIRAQPTELNGVQARWYPATRRPENLYGFYAGKRSFGAAVDEGMIADLVALDLPLGIAEQDFNAAIDARLCAVPELEAIVQEGRGGTADLQRVLIDQGISPTQAKRSVQTLMVWLQYFSNFYITPDSWELRRGREI